jgi:hypothetical protein
MDTNEASKTVSHPKSRFSPRVWRKDAPMSVRNGLRLGTASIVSRPPAFSKIWVFKPNPDPSPSLPLALVPKPTSNSPRMIHHLVPQQLQQFKLTWQTLHHLFTSKFRPTYHVAPPTQQFRPALSEFSTPAHRRHRRTQVQSLTPFIHHQHPHLSAGQTMQRRSQFYPAAHHHATSQFFARHHRGRSHHFNIVANDTNPTYLGLSNVLLPLVKISLAVAFHRLVFLPLHFHHIDTPIIPLIFRHHLP